VGWISFCSLSVFLRITDSIERVSSFCIFSSSKSSDKKMWVKAAVASAGSWADELFMILSFKIYNN